MSMSFSHVTFPGRSIRGRGLNLASPAEAPWLPREKETDLAEESEAFVRWLFSRAGLEARSYRAESLRRRLPSCLRTLRANSPAHARHLIEQTPALGTAALSAMLVGVTSLNRDPSVFDVLQRQTLPALASQRSGVYVWSAGCSDGAELYSISLMLAEMELLSGSYLLGTDCRPDAIERAKLGVFDANAIRNVSSELLDRYFERQGDCWQIVPRIRRATHWRVADILTTQEPGAWDLLLFRNVSMYLRWDAASGLSDRIETALRPGGFLVLGKAERPIGAKRLALVSPCIYKRMRG
jgi:chemotaxis protein methyltransferase CheR